MANFTEAQIQEVWVKGKIVDGYDANHHRKDLAGAWMQRDEYGNEVSKGWEIDHVYPESKGGDEQIINLRPMQHENNGSKSDYYPKYNTVVTSDGDKNIDKERTRTLTVNEDLQEKLKELYDIDS